MSQYVTILSIAGSDPCAGAGIQADIKTGMLMSTHVAAAISAITVQNSIRINSVNPVAPDIMRSQIMAVAEDIPINAVKIGMLPTAELTDVVLECAIKFKWTNIVIDPVGSASVGKTESGEAFSDPDALQRLLPLASVFTPNLTEAKMFLSEDIQDLPVREIAYRISRKFSVPTVLVTGGDTDADNVSDAFYSSLNGDEGEFFSHKIDSANTHGTGCALSTAIACGLAHGLSHIQSIARAEELIHRMIRDGKDYPSGKGNYGPIGFLGPLPSN